MKTIPFNINESVKIKLMQKGLDILRANHDELRTHVPSLGEFTPPSVDSEGYSTFQMWDLMNTFGSHMYMGNIKFPFEMNIKLLVCK